MSINRNLATFAKDVQTDGTLQDSSVRGIAVTVTVSGGKFVIDGTSQQTMFIPKGVKYRFDVSDSSVSGHPLVFSETSDGTHAGGSAYTTGITTSGTAGSSGAYVEVQLQQDAPDLLYYYCSNHSGMGAGVETAPQAVTTYTDSDVDTHLNYSSATSGQVLGYNGSDYAWVDNPSYADSDVDTHLNRSSAGSNQILSWNGSDYAWVDDQSGSGGIASVAADSTPQLGGSLDVNGNAIVSASNGNIAITPDGSGKIILDGLSFPTADGSADQVLKTDGSGQLSFVDQSGGGAAGGSLTATASGALSDGSTVAINADGTVSVIAEPRTHNIGAQAVWDTTQYSQYPNAVHHVAENKIVIFYPERSTNYLTGVVGTVSGETISFGAKQYLRSSNSNQIAAIYDPDNEKMVVAFGDWSDSGHGKSLVVSLASNGTLSVGSLVEHNSQGYNYFHSLAYDTDTNKVLMHYRGGDNKGYVNVGSISNNAMSWGSATYSFNGNCFHNRIVYDPSKQRVVVAFRDDTATTRIKAAVGTVSGTSITWGSSILVRNGEQVALAYDANAQKILLVMQDEVNSTEYLGGFVGTVASTGNSITFGSVTHVENNKGADPNLIYDPTSKTTLLIYRNDVGSPYQSKYAYATISGTSVSFTTPVNIGSYTMTTGYEPLAYDSTNDRIIFPFQDQDSDNSYDGEAVVWRTPTAGGATLTAENFIGISDGAYASGATATIQTAGAVDDAQSGLTAGQTYYVQASDGSLSTSPDTISVVAGTAISATKLLINPDSDPTITTYTDADVNTHLNVSSASANQVLSWNGSDYAWADDATGAGSITATASGALANGDMVVLNSDGTVSVVADSTQTFSAGTPATAYSSNISGDPTATYHAGANKIVAVYRDSSSNVTYAILGTVSGTSITFANQVTFESSNTIDYLASAYDSNAQAVVVCYRKQGSPFYFGAKAMTVSGTTITVGSERNLLSQQVGFCDVVFDSNVNRLVFAACDFDNAYALKAVVATVSGTTITSGSATTVHSAAYKHHMVFDSGSNKVIITYRDNANSLYGAARVLTVSNSGNSLSVGSSTYFNSARSDAPMIGYDVNANKCIVLYTDFGNSSYQTLQVGTVSATSISFGSKITGFADASFSYRAIEYDPDNQNMAMVIHRNSGGFDDTAYFPVTISGTSATVGSASEVLGASDGLESYNTRWVTYNTTANKFVLFFKNYDDNQGQGVAFQTPFDGSTNLTDENFLGVSDGAYSNGATATIQTAGSVDDAQSSLTPAQTYFVQNTGGIALTPSSPSVVAGTAISATELLIKSGQAVEKPNTTQVVASGALSDGTKVCINSDGTVSAITESIQSGSVGTATQWHAGSTTQPPSAVYDSTNGKVVIVWRKGGGGGTGGSVVGEISGTSITFGSEVNFSSGEVNYVSSVYDPDTGKIIIVYRDTGGGSSIGKAVVGTLSGTSISYGSAVNINGNNNSYLDVTYDTGNNKVVVVFSDYGDGQKGKAAVGTVSNTSISFGTATTFYNDVSRFNRVAYDSTNGKVVVMSEDFNNSNYLTASVGTVSGTGISFGNKVAFTGNVAATENDHAIAYDENSGKMIVAVGGSTGKAAVGTVSGTSISFSSVGTFDSGATSNMDAIYDPDAGKVFITYTDDANSNSGSIIPVSVSGTSISFGTQVVYRSSYSDIPTITYDTANNKVAIFYRDNAITGYMYYSVIQNAFTSQNLTATNYIGISDAAYTNGQTATIQVAGATDDAQSGLTAGQLYYVQNDGTLSTTADSPSVIAGTAISATKLIVKG